MTARRPFQPARTDRSRLMPTFTMPDIVCDVDLPRTDSSTGIPLEWVRDPEVSLTGKGLIYHVATYPQGTVVSGVELAQGWRRGQSPGKVLASLVEAGYLRSEAVDGVERFRLVHPARLGPLPTA